MEVRKRKRIEKMRLSEASKVKRKSGEWRVSRSVFQEGGIERILPNG